MDITVTQFKAKCLGIVEKVQREKCRVTISRHGRAAAELIPVPAAESSPPLFGRSAETTEILGDILETGEPWNAAS
ncbi:MAG: type II toxin-antitoxin system prevent-host-death family antitoxin [Verrucomicrobiae bacterium]|nr:type II toxin-antitoxin system prevent-host-death family antitoxin [Verrucomicrobiae bacterium]